MTHKYCYFHDQFRFSGFLSYRYMPPEKFCNHMFAYKSLHQRNIHACITLEIYQAIAHNCFTALLNRFAIGICSTPFNYVEYYSCKIMKFYAIQKSRVVMISMKSRPNLCHKYMHASHSKFMKLLHIIALQHYWTDLPLEYVQHHLIMWILFLQNYEILCNPEE